MGREPRVEEQRADQRASEVAELARAAGHIAVFAGDESGTPSASPCWQTVIASAPNDDWYATNLVRNPYPCGRRKINRRRRHARRVTPYERMVAVRGGYGRSGINRPAVEVSLADPDSTRPPQSVMPELAYWRRTESGSRVASVVRLPEGDGDDPGGDRLERHSRRSGHLSR